MSDSDELDEIRRRKAEELAAKAHGGEGSDHEATADAPGEPVSVESAAHLNELVERYDVVLVDFYADWCGPCKVLEPAVERVARETYAAVAKVDVDAHQRLAGEYGVRGVPTVVLFAGGRPAERLVGVRDGDSLKRLVEQHV